MARPHSARSVSAPLCGSRRMTRLPPAVAERNIWRSPSACSTTSPGVFAPTSCASLTISIAVLPGISMVTGPGSAGGASGGAKLRTPQAWHGSASRQPPGCRYRRLAARLAGRTSRPRAKFFAWSFIFTAQWGRSPDRYIGSVLVDETSCSTVGCSKGVAPRRTGKTGTFQAGLVPRMPWCSRTRTSIIPGTSRPWSSTGSTGMSSSPRARVTSAV